jgi:hypothetical protein
MFSLALENFLWFYLCQRLYGFNLKSYWFDIINTYNIMVAQGRCENYIQKMKDWLSFVELYRQKVTEIMC